jgi:DNA helicase II / ATP-dependent DNA helicase PcrA
MQQYRQVLVKKFDEAYQKLNTRQRRAVDTIEGPVMVIAGPGTGKTQILAARIGKILAETDAQPENILCLTYTDAGTIAMRRRLQQFIGADAYKVNIYTFHSFCNDIIQENLSMFEKTALDPVSDLEKIQLFKTLIDGFPKNHLLKRYRGDVYFEISNLQQLFSVMKREGWTPAFINKKIDEYIAALPQRDEYVAKRATKEFKKGDVRTDKIAEETEKMEKLRAAVNEFDNLQALMRQKNRYDFDDMINWVINAFEANASLLMGYQEKFQYILVDEYQDTSGTQNKLVHQLISYWEKPNVFVVGDDDQSIYRFQGASVENMLEFAQQYTADLITVVLTDNYRSTQPILDIAKTLIDKNEDRLVNQVEGLNKELKAANTNINHLTNPPVITAYKTPMEEMAGITAGITQLVEAGTAPGRIAVIYKENKYGEALAQYLRLKNIPVYSKRSVNILAEPFVNKIIQLLRWLNAEHDTPYGGDEMLFEILHYDFYNIPPMDIARLTVEVNTKKYSGEKMSIRRLLHDKAAAPAKDLFDTGLHEGLKKVSRTLEALVAYVPNVTLLTLFAKIVSDETKPGNTHLLGYVTQQPEKIALMQLLSALFDFIKEETARNPMLGLKELIDIIDLMQKENLPIPMVQVSGTDKGVNLLTAHGSKGLEFEQVFFAGCNAASWEKKRKPGGGYKFPDNIFSSATAARDVEELRRLFYVAITRAEKFLDISYTNFNAAGKELEPSMFIAEIQETHNLPVEQKIITEEALFDFRLLQLTAQAPEIARTEDDFITHALEKFAMNVTALNNYLKCPLEFYYKNLIRIPSGKSEALEFGSAIHHALQRLFEKMLDSPGKQFPPQQDIINDFKWYMNRHRENFTREAFARRMEYGEEVLNNYYTKYTPQFNKIVTVERNIRNVVVNGVPLKGKLDKLEFDGKAVNVVDYKTGDIDKALPKMKGPDEKEPNGGDYWRQAVFYKILVDNYEQKDWKVISTEFDFIEPDKKKEYRKEKIIITPEDTTTVNQQIKTVWDKIQARDFYTGCGKPDCHWCNFVKENKLAVALHDVVEEGE